MEMTIENMPAFAAWSKLFHQALQEHVFTESMEKLSEKDQSLIMLAYMRDWSKKPGIAGDIARKAFEEIAEYSYHRLREEQFVNMTA